MISQANRESAAPTAAQARRRAMHTLRVRFAATLTLLGILFAAAASIVGTIYIPGVNEDPVRLAGAPALYTAAGAGIFTLLTLLPIMYWIGGYADEARPLPLWIGIGLAFGVTSTFLTGASLPFTLTFTYYSEGAMPFSGLIDQTIDSFFRAPPSIIHLRRPQPLHRADNRHNIRHRRLDNRHAQPNGAPQRAARLHNVRHRWLDTRILPLVRSHSALGIRHRPLGARHRHRHVPIHLRRHRPHPPPRKTRLTPASRPAPRAVSRPSPVHGEPFFFRSW